MQVRIFRVHIPKAHLPEVRLFCMTIRQMTNRIGAQVASKDTRAIMAATGQDIM